jgi:hypothetical protein
MKLQKLIKKAINKLRLPAEKKSEVLTWFELHKDCTAEELKKFYEEDYGKDKKV